MIILNISRLKNLSTEVLHKDTPYKMNKDIISKMIRNEIFTYENIFKHLTVLDSMYSTNMNRRFFGIEEISKELLEFRSLNELKQHILEFNGNPHNESTIGKLYKRKYGYSKQGEKKYAQSIISKYLYFVSEFNSPIYDRLVLENHKLLVRHYRLSVSKLSNGIDIIEFYKRINTTIYNLGIRYDELDNILWLIGKIRQSSFSLILNINDFKSLLTLANGMNYEDFIKESKSKDNKKIIEIMGNELYELYSFINKNFK
jgi:hypothetical protein